MALATGIKINGVDMPSPLPYEFDVNSLDGESGRNLRGKMIRDFVADKISVGLTWKNLTTSEANLLLNAVDPTKGNVFFNATIITPSGEFTGRFYAGTRKVALGLLDGFFSEVSFSIIQE